jgi:hypothetical protein
MAIAFLAVVATLISAVLLGVTVIVRKLTSNEDEPSDLGEAGTH